MELNLVGLVIMVPALMFAVIIHEIGHGLVAYKLGDNTPVISGRLTFNPIPHIDIFGTLLFPAILILLKAPFIFGWAKPIPINPSNFKKIDIRKGTALTSFAGPLFNLISAIVFAVIYHLLNFGLDSGFITNLLGEKLTEKIFLPILLFLYYSVGINVILFLFNLLPIPSFDGWRIVLSFLPFKYERKLEPFEVYGFFIVIILLMLNIIQFILVPPYLFIMGLLM